MQTTLNQFETDLTAFIKVHPYMLEQEAEVNITDAESPFINPDDLRIEAHTPNGDYERIIIKVIHIS